MTWGTVACSCHATCKGRSESAVVVVGCTYFPKQNFPVMPILKAANTLRNLLDTISQCTANLKLCHTHPYVCLYSLIMSRHCIVFTNCVPKVKLSPKYGLCYSSGVYFW